MSRQYKISLSESAARVVCVDDGVEVPLEALPILPRGRLNQLIAKELQQRGFDVSDNGVATRVDGDIEITVDLVTSKASVRSATEQEVTVSGEKERWVEEEHAVTARERMSKDLVDELEKKIEDERQRLQIETTQRIEGRLPSVVEELDDVIGAATVAALKEKASQLGEIKEMSESDDSLTIKVKV
jgi:hypothetical protein